MCCHCYLDDSSESSSYYETVSESFPVSKPRNPVLEWQHLLMHYRPSEEQQLDMCETLSINMLQLLTENQLFEWQQIEMCKHLLKIMRPWHWMGTGWMKYICVLGVLGQNLLPERFNNVSTATFSLNSVGVNTQFSCMEFWRVFPWRIYVNLDFHSWWHMERLPPRGGSPRCTKPLAQELHHSRYFGASLQWLASSRSFDQPASGPTRSGWGSSGQRSQLAPHVEVEAGSRACQRDLGEARGAAERGEWTRLDEDTIVTISICLIVMTRRHLSFVKVIRDPHFKIGFSTHPMV